VVVWRRRANIGARLTLAAGVAVTGVWSYELMTRAADWHPYLRYSVLFLSLFAAVVIVVPPNQFSRRGVAVAAVAGLLVLGGGSAAYAADTTATPHSGSIPSAGPTSNAAAGGNAPAGRSPFGQQGNGSDPQSGQGAFPGGSSGQGAESSSNSELAALLEATSTRWAAATTGDQSAASLELASGGKAVMAIGGWSGSDPTPTLAQFQAYVAAGEIRFFIVGGAGGGPGGGAGSSGEITNWVTSNFAATSVGGQTVYDLTAPTAGG
jgi:hypothetical protein